MQYISHQSGDLNRDRVAGVGNAVAAVDVDKTRFEGRQFLFLKIRIGANDDDIARLGCLAALGDQLLSVKEQILQSIE